MKNQPSGNENIAMLNNITKFQHDRIINNRYDVDNDLKKCWFTILKFLLQFLEF